MTTPTTPSTDAIVLVGPMGAGKTSIGRRVAKRLAVGFYDSDVAVVRAHGPIEDIFATAGEERFRELEREAVRVGLETGGVVALGGGAVMDAATRADLAHHRVVLLTVTPEVVASRLADTTRPLLQTEDALARWSEIMEQRRPLYEAVADVVFDTSTGPLSDVVDAIVAWARKNESTGMSGATES
ncbi:shikimate kinase [Microbacterium sp. X-17]|uniref:shikimate kinase n=1 Tax=Microbacterium sp. X-17 TaxID=3144404 RepID=UPI0031F5513F